MGNNEDFLKQIGHRVAVWRKIRSMTLRELGELAEIGPSNISKLENGSAAVSYDRLQRIAVALRVPPAILFDPSSPYATVRGTVTGSGRWLPAFDPGSAHHPLLNPLLPDKHVYPLILPAFIQGAGCAFDTESGKSFLICGTPCGNKLELGKQYVVIRGRMRLPDDNNHDAKGPIFEIAIRSFDTIGTEPSRLDSQPHEYLQATTGPMDHRYVAPTDPDITMIFPVIAWFRIDGPGVENDR